MSKTDTEIADGYVALQHAPKESQEYDELFWAFEETIEVPSVRFQDHARHSDVSVRSMGAFLKAPTCHEHRFSGVRPPSEF